MALTYSATLLGIGFLIGAALCWAVLRHAARIRAEAAFEPQQLVESRRIGRAALSEGRSARKAEVGRGLVPSLWALRPEQLPFVPADVRFVGHPAHFLVFEGHTVVKSDPSAQIDQVTLLFLADGADCPDADLVEECILDGRFRWETLTIRSDPAELG